ncbi:MAG: hypothetical protein HKN84_12405 [Gammaproteobacteria bacterium]|nr:hypothetical protein [Gammaproteobacteria bacterium]
MLFGAQLAGAQNLPDEAAASIPRTADGRPDLSGIWQSFTTANWNILAHSAETGPHDDVMGVWSAQRGGLGIVEGNEIPYQPWAVEKQKENFANRMVVNVTNDPSRFDTGDPEIQCFRAGVPRANYMPFPFQIVQTPEQVFMIYEYKGAYREINIDSDSLAPSDTWMGWSNGHWDGDTLVVDVTGFNGYTWFDRAGNFHSDALHVVERWTPLSPYHIRYEATIEDPNVFTRPWTMSFTLYKNIDPDAQLVEFNCVPFAEKLMYEPLGLFGR